MRWAALREMPLTPCSSSYTSHEQAHSTASTVLSAWGTSWGSCPTQLCTWECVSTGLGRQGSSPEWPCGSVSQPTKSPWEASGEMRWEILKVCSAMRHPNGKCSCLDSDIQDTVTLWFPSMAVSLIIFPHSLM